jgi:Mn-dependent DtxR family transcriptional regulator
MTKYDVMKKQPFLLVPVFDERETTARLTSVDRLVYAYLLFLVRKDRGACQSDISASLRIDREAVVSSLERLATHKLVVLDKQIYQATQPPYPVFRVRKDPANSWVESFVYDRVYLPERASDLPLISNLLYWHLVRKGVSIEKMPGHLRVGGTKNKYLTFTYLSRGLRCDRKTVRNALDRLGELGLVNLVKYGKGYAAGLFPIGKKKSLWRSSWKPVQEDPPPVSMHQLFGVPSPVAVTEDLDFEKPIKKLLRKYGVTGRIGEEVAAMILKNDVDPSVWRPMLEQASKDHSTNVATGRARTKTCGFLFKYMLQTHLEIREERRTQWSPPDSEVLNLADALQELGLLTREITLLQQVTHQMNLLSDDGAMIPTKLDKPQVISLAKASRSKKMFKLSIAGQIFGEHIVSAGSFRWYREWMSLEGDILPDTAMLEAKGVSFHSLRETRDSLVYLLHEGSAKDVGDVADRTNRLQRLACWQSGQFRRTRAQDRILAAAQDIINTLVEDDDKKWAAGGTGELSTRGKHLFRKWHQKEYPRYDD